MPFCDANASIIWDNLPFFTLIIMYIIDNQRYYGTLTFVS